MSNVCFENILQAKPKAVYSSYIMLLGKKCKKKKDKKYKTSFDGRHTLSFLCPNRGEGTATTEAWWEMVVRCLALPSPDAPATWPSWTRTTFEGQVAGHPTIFFISSSTTTTFIIFILTAVIYIIIFIIIMSSLFIFFFPCGAILLITDVLMGMTKGLFFRLIFACSFEI